MAKKVRSNGPHETNTITYTKPHANHHYKHSGANSSSWYLVWINVSLNFFIIVRFFAHFWRSILIKSDNISHKPILINDFIAFFYLAIF